MYKRQIRKSIGKIFIFCKINTLNLDKYTYSVTSFSAASLSADLGLVRLDVSSEKIHLVRF